MPPCSPHVIPAAILTLFSSSATTCGDPRTNVDPTRLNPLMSSLAFATLVRPSLMQFVRLFTTGSEVRSVSSLRQWPGTRKGHHAWRISLGDVNVRAHGQANTAQALFASASSRPRAMALSVCVFPTYSISLTRRFFGARSKRESKRPSAHTHPHAHPHAPARPLVYPRTENGELGTRDPPTVAYPRSTADV
mgnify:CR=1 FL=1